MWHSWDIQVCSFHQVYAWADCVIFLRFFAFNKKKLLLLFSLHFVWFWCFFMFVFPLSFFFFLSAWSKKNVTKLSIYLIFKLNSNFYNKKKSVLFVFAFIIPVFALRKKNKKVHLTLACYLETQIPIKWQIIIWATNLMCKIISFKKNTQF